MQRSQWSAPTSDDEAKRRAGGRARYNAIRSTDKIRRWIYILLPLLGGQPPERGQLAALAARLGVSKATVSRDVSSLKRANMLDGHFSAADLQVLAKVGENVKFRPSRSAQRSPDLEKSSN